MSQQMSIPQLQGQISNMRGKVQQCGAGLQAARKAAEQAVSEFRSKESRRDSLEERVDDLRDRISDLHNEMSSLDDEDEASRDNLRSEIRGCSEMIRDYSSEIRDIEQEMSQLQQRIQVNQQRGQQYAGILTQCREALKQIDQQLVGHIQERSQAGSRMEVLQRMNYASTAGSPAGKLSQDVTLCEQERQKLASMQSEITRYLDDGVVVQAPEAQKKTYSGPGGAGRASPEAPVLPGLSDNSPGADSPVLPGLSAAVDSGPSHIETAKTVGTPVAAPSMVSMAPPGNGAQVDVSDIRQAAEANRGKWADAGGFRCTQKSSGAGDSMEHTVDDFHEKFRKLEKMRNDTERKIVDDSDRATVQCTLAEENDRVAAEMEEMLQRVRSQEAEANSEDKILRSLPETPEVLAERHRIEAEKARLSDMEETLKHDASYLRDKARDLRKEYSSKTTFRGVTRKRLAEITSMLIPRQGRAVAGFDGTCACCCIANCITMLGGQATEKSVVGAARENKLCVDKPIKARYSSKKADKIARHNGATSIESQIKLVEKLGYRCEHKDDQDLKDIFTQLQSGKTAMIGIRGGFLKDGPTKNFSPFQSHEANHMVTITGIQVDENGEPCGMWIHDTGGFVSEGNEFYCSKETYKKWMKQVGCPVQYISRKEDA